MEFTQPLHTQWQDNLLPYEYSGLHMDMRFGSSLPYANSDIQRQPSFGSSEASNPSFSFSNTPSDSNSAPMTPQDNGYGFNPMNGETTAPAIPLTPESMHSSGTWLEDRCVPISEQESKRLLNMNQQSLHSFDGARQVWGSSAVDGQEHCMDLRDSQSLLTRSLVVVPQANNYISNPTTWTHKNGMRSRVMDVDGPLSPSPSTNGSRVETVDPASTQHKSNGLIQAKKDMSTNRRRKSGRESSIKRINPAHCHSPRTRKSMKSSSAKSGSAQVQGLTCDVAGRTEPVVYSETGMYRVNAHACHRCDGRFQKKEHLRRHLRSCGNKDDKPFFCPVARILGDNFCRQSKVGRQDNMYQHLASHLMSQSEPAKNRNCGVEYQVLKKCTERTGGIHDRDDGKSGDTKKILRSVLKACQKGVTKAVARTHISHHIMYDLGFRWNGRYPTGDLWSHDCREILGYGRLCGGECPEARRESDGTAKGRESSRCQ